MTIFSVALDRLKPGRNLSASGFTRAKSVRLGQLLILRGVLGRIAAPVSAFVIGANSEECRRRFLVDAARRTCPCAQAARRRARDRTNLDVMTCSGKAEYSSPEFRADSRSSVAARGAGDAIIAV